MCTTRVGLCTRGASQVVLQWSYSSPGIRPRPGEAIIKNNVAMWRRNSKGDKEGRNDSLKTSTRVQTPLPAEFYTRSHELERATKPKVPNSSHRNPVARRRRDPPSSLQASPQAVMTAPADKQLNARGGVRCPQQRRLGPPRVFADTRGGGALSRPLAPFRFTQWGTLTPSRAQTTENQKHRKDVCVCHG